MKEYILKVTSEGNVPKKINALFPYLYRTPPADKRALMDILGLGHWKYAHFCILNGTILWFNINALVPLKYSHLPQKELLGTEPQRIFFDLDGTVAEWGADKTMEEVFSKGYFATRPVMESVRGAMSLISGTPGFDCRILSAYSPEYGYILSDKKAWIKRELPFMEEGKCFFSINGKSKLDFVPFPREDDVLVDDYNKNLKEWHGIPIKMLNGVNSDWEGRLVSQKMDGRLLADCIMGLAKV